MFEANSCGILSAIHEQSPDINQGVDRKEKQEQGAGDQGIMFGYASNETENLMPLALDLAHRLLYELAALRREDKEITYLRPDSKRSEEHTSELQSLMRISYAVFCLKQKIHTYNITA